MSKEKQKKSLLDLITAENLQEVNSDKKGLEESTKRFNEVTEFLFATDEVQKVLKEKEQKIADLEAKLIESETKLNQYPYKNEVIEEQYEDLKDAITFLMLNNIKDQEQLNYSIDVLCEKHKARIRDIENGICRIEQLEKQLAEKEKEIECLRTRQFIDMTEKEMLELKIATHNEDLKKIKHIFDQDKISFAVSYLEVLKAFIIDKEFYYLGEDYSTVYVEDIIEEIDNQIKAIKEME